LRQKKKKTKDQDPQEEKDAQTLAPSEEESLGVINAFS